jgi:hypothetical protein
MVVCSTPADALYFVSGVSVAKIWIRVPDRHAHVWG